MKSPPARPSGTGPGPEARPEPGPGPEAGPEPVTGCLLIQVAAKETAEMLRLADRPGSGLVFTGAGGIEAVEATRRHGWRHPMLTDRRRYAGAARVRGTASFVSSWLAGQRGAGIRPVLTDSGYVGDGDIAALRSVLSQAAEAGPGVTAVLPLHRCWLRDDRATLIAEVAAHSVPVALVLEHARDPLGTPEDVAGLLELLRAWPSVGLLGTGIAALAALAYGAQWAAVGVRRSLRHFPPAAMGEAPAPWRRRWRPSPHEVVAGPVLSFSTVDKVVSAYKASGGNRAWVCRCPRCHGRTPEWLVTASALDAGAHTFGVLARHAEQLLRHAPGPAREQAWHAKCRRATVRHRELGLAALGWKLPGAIAAGAASASASASASAKPPLRSAG